MVKEVPFFPGVCPLGAIIYTWAGMKKEKWEEGAISSTQLR